MTADEPHADLSRLRERISEVDDQLIRIIGERRELVLQVGALKHEMGLPVLDPAREAQVVRRAAERARELGVDEEMTRDVVWRIIQAARQAQEGRPAGWPARRPSASGESAGAEGPPEVSDSPGTPPPGPTAPGEPGPGKNVPEE